MCAAVTMDENYALFNLVPDATPSFKHTDENCVYLGTNVAGYDLYFYTGSETQSPMARNGDEPEEYTSGINFCFSDPCLNMALHLANKKGLINRSFKEQLKHVWESERGPLNVIVTYWDIKSPI
jgi:hypothetical protein